MGQRRYPPLTPSEVVAILKALGFSKKHQEGAHAQYECAKTSEHARSVVTVDIAYREFDDMLMQSMIRQSNRSREMFYGATKRTAKKASVPFLKLSPSTDPE
jgi:predicted RNA binding protein YcfA (HicA-like mRNA interferase family)